MMYVVLEMQTTANETTSIAKSYADRNVADSEYYDVLKYAAVSEVPIHTAVLLSDDGCLLKSDSYKHPEETVEPRVIPV